MSEEHEEKKRCSQTRPTIIGCCGRRRGLRTTVLARANNKRQLLLAARGPARDRAAASGRPVGSHWWVCSKRRLLHVVHSHHPQATTSRSQGRDDLERKSPILKKSACSSKVRLSSAGCVPHDDDRRCFHCLERGSTAATAAAAATAASCCNAGTTPPDVEAGSSSFSADSFLARSAALSAAVFSASSRSPRQKSALATT